MKNRKALLVGTILTISMLTTVTAQAGLMEWLGISDAQAQRASTGSFDELYAAVFAESPAANDAPMLTANSTAVMAVTSPVGGVQRTLRRTYTVEVSGYNSEVAQTDDSPFIGAAGTHMRQGVVAANIIDSSGRNIPLFTAIKFKNCGSLDESAIYIVEDRLNKRYTRNVDVWFEHKADALKLGRRTCQIEVIQ